MVCSPRIRECVCCQDCFNQHIPRLGDLSARHGTASVLPGLAGTLLAPSGAVVACHTPLSTLFDFHYLE